MNVIFVHELFIEKSVDVVYERFKNDILFLGITSLETFPFPSPNPRSYPHLPRDKYLNMFPGWLNMYWDNVLPSNVKVLNMSQSNFSVPDIDYEKEVDEGRDIKRFVFAYVPVIRQHVKNP